MRIDPASRQRMEMEDATESSEGPKMDEDSNDKAIQRELPLPALLLRLRHGASRCCENSKAGDIQGSENAVAEFVGVLNDVAESVNSAPDNEEAREKARQILQETKSLITSDNPESQMLLDLVALELPRVIGNYVDISDACREICESIANYVWQTCNPRDMVPALCEALCSSYRTGKKLSSFLPLLYGFCIVVSRIQRRHVEHMKLALPVLLNIGKAAASKAADDDNENIAKGVFEKLIAIAISLQDVCKKELGSKNYVPLRSILGLYTLQLLALVSKDKSIAHSVIVSKVPSLVLQLSELLSYCGLSYLGLITGREVDVAIHSVAKDGDDMIEESTSLVNHGATLAVLWGYIFEEVAKVASENVGTLLGRLKSSKSEKMMALSVMKYLFSSLDYAWHIKKHAIEFLLIMVKGDKSPKDFDVKIDWPAITPSLFSLCQALQQVMVYAPDSELRKKSFCALKEVLRELPPHQKFDMLKALITNSNYPSMASLLLGIVKDEISNVFLKKFAPTSQEGGLRDKEWALESPFVTGDVLELVEFILKPAKGGPPDLPGQSDAVLAALNLYRFLLMMESHGKTNYTQVLSKRCLQKAHSEWLLPLRVLVSGIRSENENDSSEFANATVCAINPIELVLYHCLELVEENLKYCK